MTKQEIKPYLGQFGEIAYNSSPSPGAFHGFISEIKHSTIIFRRLHGNPITIKIDAIQSFIPKLDPKLKYTTEL